MSGLKDKIVGSCSLCGGQGYLGSNLCSCSIKFRVYNRLVSGGFNEETLDLVSSSSYALPMLEQGGEFLDYFLLNPMVVMEKGLGLFICSKENGRGKTTLAHHIAYTLAWPFALTENYSRDRRYAFRDVHSLFKIFNSGPDDGMEDAWKATVLVIDDMGFESRSGWRKDTALSMYHQIFHYRRDNKLPTIITANFMPPSLSQFYDGVLDSVLEIRPDGVIGGQVFRQVEVGGGEDYRLSTSGWPD